MSVTFGGAHYYTKQGNEYNKTNFFKRLGTLAGATLLIPTGMRFKSMYPDFTPDSFIKYVKEGNSEAARETLKSLNTEKLHINNKFIKNIGKKVVGLLDKSSIARGAGVVGGLALLAGAFIVAGRLVGSLFDGVINACKRGRADRRAAA